MAKGFNQQPPLGSEDQGEGHYDSVDGGDDDAEH